MLFTINGKMPSLNEVVLIARRNRFEANRIKIKLQKKIKTQLLHQMTKLDVDFPLDYQCDFKFTFYEKNRKRDKDNIISCQKFLFDSLVEIGILKNDGWKWVGNLAYEFKIGDDYKVEIEVSDATDTRPCDTKMDGISD